MACKEASRPRARLRLPHRSLPPAVVLTSVGVQASAAETSKIKCFAEMHELHRREVDSIASFNTRDIESQHCQQVS
ncbi:hypothetical protein PTKU64_93400 (plasmid) [Paraburkholderia terrae]|uniref:Secreted protein n=1 Tax=Paraburkholderia terrae TaxID=311230 RepID=A0ABM7UBI6_9BURK|nr:hypothetical protein PTKU64_93400 [Paraburkholderia terrae]